MILKHLFRMKFIKSGYIYLMSILLTLLSIGSDDIYAQYDNIVFERINTSNGLSNNIVQKILQDSKGYLWIGTTDGLNKYDGYSFTTFRHDPDDTSSISHNNIWAIYEDKNNDLWIANNDGLNLYNREKGNFKSYGYAPYSENFTNAVLSIYEDSKGTFWLGTVTKGLLIFDRKSKKFTPFMVDSSLTSGGNSNVIYQIAEEVKTKGKRLLLGKWDMGFGYFDIEKKEFTEYEHDPNNAAGLGGTRTMATFQDRDGNVWLGTQGGGLNKFNPDTKEFIHYKNDPKNEHSLSNNHVWSIFQDPNDNGILWIGTAGGLNIFDIRTNSFKSFKSDIDDLTTLSNNTIRDIYQDQSGVIWIATHGGLNKIDPGRVPFRHYNYTEGKKNWLNSNQVNALIKSGANSNILWIGTSNGGLNKYDKSSNSFRYFKHDPNNVNTLGSNLISSLYEDPQEAGELLWIGTNGGGLTRFDLKNNRFKRYVYDDADLSSISSNNIRHIYESRDGMLWLSTPEGLNRFDRKKEIFTQYLHQDTSYNNTVQNLVKDFSARKNPISSILQAGEGEDSTETFKLSKKTSLLIISVGEGTTAMWDYGWLEDSNGNTIWKSEFDKSGHAGGGIKNRIQIWTGTLDAGEYKLRYVSDIGHSYGNWNTPPPINPNLWGIQVFEINSTEQNLLSTNLEKFEKPNSIVGSNVNSVVEDSYGMLWIATSVGLSKLDRKTGKFTSYTFEATGPGNISNSVILSLHVDHNGTLWAGTRNGLNRFDSKNNSFKTYSVKDGLPNNIIINILEDNNGHLWLATNNGISKFNPDDESQYGYLTFINYNIQDGLRYNQYIRSSMHKAADGEMFFGGYNGFVSFFPGKSNIRTPNTLLSNFRIFNESITPGEDSPLEKHISETEKISLTYDQNAFSFEFVALHFAQPTKNKYLYKMDGFDKNWIDGHRRFAPYTNLDPGDYTFRVKAANSDGIWNDEGTSLSITILPPWWRTIWAYIGYGLLFLALIFGIDRLQRRRLMAKTKERMKIQAAEHRAEAAELQARAVQAENERKTKELEEARQLQLSMLPKELPQLPNLDIAVYMQTATEVGGDYYDFHVSLDGTLTIVVGDATGHGMKAGTMVTTAKSLFNSYAPNPDIIYSFQEITRCIRQMNFSQLSMCLTMVKIKGLSLQMSTAGMPPSFIFRKDTRVVEEHLFQAMPLGSMEKFPYKTKDTTLNPGDTILLISDGLPELQNKNGEVYGYKRTRIGFEDVAEKTPEEIINYFKNEGASWVDNENPDDDVTFVVIKVKE